MKDKVISFALISNHRFNTKNGFKLIYEEMKGGRSFNAAIRKIICRRNISMICIKNTIDNIENRYNKERCDYIHAVSNNNINNYGS